MKINKLKKVIQKIAPDQVSKYEQYWEFVYGPYTVSLILANGLWLIQYKSMVYRNKDLLRALCDVTPTSGSEDNAYWKFIYQRALQELRVFDPVLEAALIELEPFYLHFPGIEVIRIGKKTVNIFIPDLPIRVYMTLKQKGKQEWSGEAYILEEESFLNKSSFRELLKSIQEDVDSQLNRIIETATLMKSVLDCTNAKAKTV